MSPRGFDEITRTVRYDRCRWAKGIVVDLCLYHVRLHFVSSN
jgi:hypothetical protein